MTVPAEKGAKGSTIPAPIKPSGSGDIAPLSQRRPQDGVIREVAASAEAQPSGPVTRIYPDGASEPYSSIPKRAVMPSKPNGSASAPDREMSINLEKSVGKPPSTPDMEGSVLPRGDGKVATILKPDLMNATSQPEIGPKGLKPGPDSAVVRATGKDKGYGTSKPDTVKRYWRGIEVQPGGRVMWHGMRFQGCHPCLEVHGGSVSAEQSIWQGEGRGAGLKLHDARTLHLKGTEWRGFKRALVVEAGWLMLLESTLNDNDVGMDLRGGRVSLERVNLYGNGLNMESRIPVTLEGNYLGGMQPDQWQLQGPITVRSLLDAPWPKGKNQTYDPEAGRKQAAALRDKGLDAFNARNYATAHEHLSASLKLHEDRTVRLTMAYILNAMRKDQELDALLEDAYRLYPLEARFINIGVRRLLAKGRKEEARTLLQKVLKRSPENRMLQGLRFFMEE